MSVLIKGIDMPISCADCFLEDAYDGYNCRIAQKSANWGLGERPSWCPLAEAPEWIPVKERLPEQNGKYRAFALGEENTMDFYDGHWMLYGTDYRRYVTHWMPCQEPPEPPKEETC